MEAYQNSKPIFTTEFTTTLKEYKKMAFMLMRRKMIMLSVAEVIIFSSLGIISINENNGSRTAFYFLFATAFPFLFYLLYSIKLSNIYNSTKLTQDLTSTYCFYDDYIEIKNHINNGVKIPYSKLYKKIETKTHFYLLLGKSQAFGVRKDKCSLELLGFIRNINICGNKND